MDSHIPFAYDPETPAVCTMDSHPSVESSSPSPQAHIIRLIELQPGGTNDPLVAVLSTHELESAPYFEAISYVWGHKHSPKPLRCNQKNLKITANLDAALRRIRLGDRSRLIWVDAICINQGEDRERSHHVSFMNLIYKRAARVLVCMGNDSDGGAKDVVDLIEEHNERMSGHALVATLPILATDDPVLKDPRWRSVGTLMNCVWFTRAWVLQEVGVAADPCVLYGSIEFKYRDLMRLSRWIVLCAESVQSVAGIDLETIHSDWEDWSDNWRTKAEHDYTLLDFLSHAKCLGCKDAQDHVYAFLGHPLAQLEDGRGPIITPDYENKTAGGLYQELSEWMLPRFGLGVLSAVEHDERTINEDLPCWVVRWNIHITWNSMGYYPDFYYRASGGKDPKTFMMLTNGLLTVQTMSLGVVASTYQFSAEQSDWKTSDALTFLHPTSCIHGVLDRIWRDINSPSTPCKYPPEQRLEALSLTLGAGLRNYARAEDDLGQYQANFAAFEVLRHRALLRECIPADLQQRSTHGVADDFHFDMNLSCKGRSFFITKTGYYGLGPWITKPGDECGILKGARVPFVLRRESGQVAAKLVGEAYVHGIMNGELLKEPGADQGWGNLNIR